VLRLNAPVTMSAYGQLPTLNLLDQVLKTKQHSPTTTVLRIGAARASATPAGRRS
jgi:hypothetical protein